jgi:alcohol dehydrogenase YqhD (iron-dependent ADH family)
MIMNNFELCIPTKIVFGKGRVAEIGTYAKEYGEKLLLVYGKNSIKKSGIYETVIKSLKDVGLTVFEHPGVKSNPLLSHTKEGILIAKSKKVDFILGVGGGSVIDEAKAIAAGTLYDGDVWDFYKGTAKIKAALPVLSVLTIPATASEMNGGTVITNEETMQKFGFMDQHLFPKVSILDPSVTYTIPADYTAFSAVDAIAHLIEGYFTHNQKPYPIQDRYVEGLVNTIMESAEIILKNPEDYESRATFMWAASLAWNGLATAGVEDSSYPNHMFAHILGAQYDIAHGAALSIIIPAWMKYKYKENISQFAGFAEAIFGIKENNQETAAIRGMEQLKSWFKKIGSPVSFKDAKLPEDELEKLASEIIDLSKVWGVKGYPKQVILDILNLCL